MTQVAAPSGPATSGVVPPPLGEAAAPSVLPPALGWAGRLRKLLQRLRRGPDTLFGRLACLLALVVVVSHLLALSLMFEFRGPPPRRRIPPCHRSWCKAKR